MNLPNSVVQLCVIRTIAQRLSNITEGSSELLQMIPILDVFSTKSLSSVSYPFLSYSETSVADINFQSEVYDTGNRFSTPTYTTNVSVTSNNYNVKANISLAFVVKKGVTDVSSATTVSSGQVKVFIYKGASQIAMNILDLTTATLGSSGANNIQLDLPNYVPAGNQNLTVKIQFTSVILVASSGTGTYSLEATVNSGSNFSSEFASKAVYQGKQVYTIDFIPENVKQSVIFFAPNLPISFKGSG